MSPYKKYFAIQTGDRIRWKQPNEGVVTKISLASGGGGWFEVDFGDGNVWSFDSDELAEWFEKIDG